MVKLAIVAFIARAPLIERTGELGVVKCAELIGAIWKEFALLKV